MSVVTDEQILTINDPGGAFKARIKNIARSKYTTPFLLSLHIYFEASDLDEAHEVAEELMASCLNLLALATGCGVRKHRIRQIVDAETSSQKSMRDVRLWAENIEYDDPQPFLNDEITGSIERLLEHDIPSAIRRALRWYRLGIDELSPDDQFTYFWFALEIVAEFQKPTERVNDKCPRCQSPLFCESCQEHPAHRPYAKQAIRALIKTADPKCSDDTVDLLEKTRNSLMHGATLREIERNLPDPHEQVVDILGRILWNALIRHFPAKLIDGLFMGTPSTYVHYNSNLVTHIQTLVPIDQQGYFELDFSGIKAEFKPTGPPQSAAPFFVRMTVQQYDQLGRLAHQSGDHREMLQRIRENFRGEEDGYITVLVLATDMSIIRQAVDEKQEGEWQILLREILEPTNGR